MHFGSMQRERLSIEFVLNIKLLNLIRQLKKNSFYCKSVIKFMVRII